MQQPSTGKTELENLAVSRSVDETVPFQQRHRKKRFFTTGLWPIQRWRVFGRTCSDEPITALRPVLARLRSLPPFKPFERDLNSVSLGYEASDSFRHSSLISTGWSAGFTASSSTLKASYSCRIGLASNWRLPRPQASLPQCGRSRSRSRDLVVAGI